MLADDVEPAIAAVRDGGWGDRRASLEFYIRHAETRPFVAEAHGIIVGTGVATQNGQTGWVGLIFTAPASRGRGLGAAITRVVVQDLEGLGCRSMLLAATELGRPVYDRLGFVKDGEYVLFRGSSRGDAPSDPRLRSMRPEDVDAVCALDRQVSGEDRSHVICAVRDGWILADGGEITGYALRTPWGVGPAIAADQADGRLLVEVLRSQSHSDPMIVTIPVENQAGAEYLRSVGFVEQRRLPRMRLGEPVAWQPEAVWAIFGFAMG
jgi:GNAT superfamily N-acetyltransferase